MNKRLMITALIYGILNAFFVILPQFEENQGIKTQLESENIIKVVSESSISRISDLEIISTVDTMINSCNLEKTSYEYAREEQENLQAHIITLSIEGESRNITEFIKMLSRIKGIQLSELTVTRQENTMHADLSLAVIGGKYEKHS
ncbi:MAG: hypothetical protein KBF01_03145 [Proteocatella sp.]|nr:hypothetical protein [Proteocatella sp.]MBP9658686.1 hypothetical protein [Proteocatella sp.]MBP9966704.1 hypothetical protein [Proteocatella sp.]